MCKTLNNESKATAKKILYQLVTNTFRRTKQNLEPKIRKTHLQEGLDLAPELDLPLGHALGDLPRVPVNSGDESMAERFVGSALVIRLHDHSLASGITSRQDQDNFSRFHNFAHLDLDEVFSRF